MNYADIKRCDVANGLGVRTSLFVSGCTHHCKGCFNSETWDFHYGNPFTDAQIDEIIENLKPSHIAGLTVLGGEPFEPQNQPEVLKTVKKVKETYPEKDIWVYSGYLFDKDILDRMCKESDITKELLNYIDVLVDGEFVEEKKNLKLVFRGSENQRIIKVPESLKAGKIILWEHEYGKEEENE